MSQQGNKEELKNSRKQMIMKIQQFKICGTAKAVLRGKYIVIQAFLKKQERSQIHNLTLHLKEREKEQQRKPKPSRRREIIKIRAEINEIGTKKNNRTNQ